MLSIEKTYRVTIDIPVTVNLPAFIVRSVKDEDGLPDEDIEICDDVDIESVLRDEIKKNIKDFVLNDFEETI